MKNYFRIILLAFLPMMLHAQEKGNPDSLRQALKMETTDSAKYFTTFKLFKYYGLDNVDSALNYIDQCLLIARKNNYKINEADCLQDKGFELTRLGKYAESFESFQEAFKIAEDSTNENKALKLDNKFSFHQNRLDVLGWAHYQFATIGGFTNSTDQQIFQFRKTLQLAEAVGDNVLAGLAISGIGDIYKGRNELNSALTSYQKAEQINQRTSFENGASYVWLQEGEIYGSKGDKNKQLYYYHKGVEAFIKLNDKLNLSGAYEALANYFLQEKQKDSSLYYAKKNVEVLNSIKSNNNGWAYLTVSKSYQLRNEIDGAYKYQDLALAGMYGSYQSEIKKHSEFQKQSFKDQMRVKQLEQEKASYQSKIRTNILLGGLFTLLVIAFFLFRNNRQKQKANRLIAQQKEKVENTLVELKSTQSQLIQSEKMASLGELTAGIAHEIQNPLNFVNNFSEVNKELLVEMKDEINKGNIDNANAIANDIIENEEKINHHGKRASDIVKGMLQHSRASAGVKESTNINALADEYLKLSYQGQRAKVKSFNSAMKTNFDENIGNINIIPQDIGRVLLNLYNNAFYAVAEKKKLNIENYESTVSVSTKKMGDRVEIRVKDNGNGIPQKVVDKIFQPFFTTKPTGVGTGLGLSLSYDIVKAHGGEIRVNTIEGEFTEFVVQLPA